MRNKDQNSMQGKVMSIFRKAYRQNIRLRRNHRTAFRYALLAVYQAGEQGGDEYAK